MKMYYIGVCNNCLCVTAVRETRAFWIGYLDKQMVCCEKPDYFLTRYMIELEDDELKSCPFCGSACIKLHDGRLIWAVCDFCGARTEDRGSNESAVMAWNMRA